MRKKLGLALGAGGARGVAHIGFLQALSEEGIAADAVTGASMGAVVGSLYCAGVPSDVVRERAFRIKFSDLVALNPAPVHANGLFRFKRARKLLGKYLGERGFSDLKIPFACVATDLRTGKPVLLREGNVADAVIASSSIPGAVTPAKLDGSVYVDGGITDRVPFSYLKEMGADVVVAVDVLGNLMEKRPTGRLLDTVLRCFDILDMQSTAQKHRERADAVDLWLEPDLGDMDQYKLKNLRFAYDRGYEMGRENAPRIRALLGE